MFLQGTFLKNFQYVTCIDHFYCSCRAAVHESYVLTCKNHKCIVDYAFDKKCKCKELQKDEVCKRCIYVKDCNNDTAVKICMQQIPEQFMEKVVSLGVFLRDKLFSCEPSDYHVYLDLDNQSQKYVFNKETD